MPLEPNEARRQSLLTAAIAYRDDDPDPTTRAQAEAFIARANAGDPAAWSELEERFGSALEFGTAGLRGLLGAGDNRMNVRVVARTTAGVCAYLAATVPDARARGLCIGFDGRHGSRAFAEEAARVATGAGFVVHRWDDFVPTPLLAFSVLERVASGGIMITASHNPAAYNGYKVYLDDGAPLSSPHDRGIAGAIEQLPSALALPRLALEDARTAGLVRDCDGVLDCYLERVARAVGRSADALPIVAAYTALHGVGEATARRVFARIGAAQVHSVQAQAVPDPEFPTVRFPNPEEPGALDLVLALGESCRATLALANDPDADRLAVAARDPSGRLAALSGNELGVLLADHLLARAPQDGKNLVVSTIVSTPLLERIATAHNAHCARTLTGFKWIVQRGLELQRASGLRFVLGFEEALGYCIGDAVRDKDGLAAAAHTLHMAELHARDGVSLHGALAALYRQHGLCESSQVSFTRPGTSGLAEISAAMKELRAKPPRTLAGIAVVAVRDLAHGGEGLPPSDVFVLTLDGDHRITIRPSGTEPKLKIYLDVWASLEASGGIEPARQRARLLTLQLTAALTPQLGLSPPVTA